MPSSTPRPQLPPDVTIVVYGGGRLQLDVDAASVRVGARASDDGALQTGADRTRLELEAIAADPAADHSVEAIAERIGVSVRHLSRLFAQHVGTTPARHVERVRVEAAQMMLTSTHAALPEIATRVGFGSPETMRRAFLRTIGIPPGAYRTADYARRNPR